MFPDFLQDLLPDSWFNAIRGLFGSSLTDDMIMPSVTDASDFFHIDEPFGVAESDTIGVYPLNPYTVNDDIILREARKTGYNFLGWTISNSVENIADIDNGTVLCVLWGNNF